MKTYVFCALVGFMLVTPSLVGQTNATAPTPVPEEARKHLIMGTALFKDAKTHDDYVEVESEFKQATDLAPQWPDPRYNLALAKEAAGDYAGAMADLKLYLQFKLPDTEARTAQDKIYILEARQRKASEEANSPAAQLERLVKSLDGGVWKCVSSTYDIPPGQFPSNPRGTFGRDGFHQENGCVGHNYIAISGHTINLFSLSGYDGRTGHTHEVDYDPSATPSSTATLTGRKFNPRPVPEMNSSEYLEYSHEATISDDGQSITERISASMQNLRDNATQTYTRIK